MCKLLGLKLLFSTFEETAWSHFNVEAHSEINKFPVLFLLYLRFANNTVWKIIIFKFKDRKRNANVSAGSCFTVWVEFWLEVCIRLPKQKLKKLAASTCTKMCTVRINFPFRTKTFTYSLVFPLSIFCFFHLTSFK